MTENIDAPTVKPRVMRAISLAGGPTVLVGHSYDGIVITNAAYNNKNVTGLVYVAALAPDDGQSLGDFFDIAKLLKGNISFCSKLSNRASSELR